MRTPCPAMDTKPLSKQLQPSKSYTITHTEIVLHVLLSWVGFPIMILLLATIIALLAVFVLLGSLLIRASFKIISLISNRQSSSCLLCPDAMYKLEEQLLQDCMCRPSYDEITLEGPDSSPGSKWVVQSIVSEAGAHLPNIILLHGTAATVGKTCFHLTMVNT